MADNNQSQQPVTKRELSANNYVVAVAAGSLVILLITGFAGKYLLEKIIINTKVINKKLTAVRELDTKLSNAPKLIDEYRQLGAKETLIMNALPTTPEFPQIVAIMDAIGAASGVAIESVSPGQDGVAVVAPTSSDSSAVVTTDGTEPPKVGAPKPQEMAFSVEASGPYERIVSMLKAIEQSARPLRVTSVEFTGNSTDLSSTIQITTYYQDPSSIEDTTEEVK